MFAGVIVVGGLLWNGGLWISDKEKGEQASEERVSLRSNLTDSSTSGDAKPASNLREKSWGDAAVRLGGCFMVAMVVGSLLRVFVKTMFIFLLVVGGALWFLEHEGVIDPFWHQYMSSWDATREWLVAQTDSVKSLLKGYLPSAGAALVGFGFGLGK